ncbi:hypothetical protein T06_11527 [Trichinella sp. T6]|nr:hypothetical protein T06_11527 [Trichinella sp. T6]
MDGTFCGFSLQQRQQFLQRAKELDVCNIDMEASCFTALCQRAKLTVDRNQRDYLSWEERPFAVVDEYVKQFSN